MTSIFDLLDNMEQFMEEYLSIFKSLPKSSFVIERRKKLMTDYITKALLNEAKDRQCCVQPYLNKAVSYLLTYHDETKCCDGGKCMNAYKHHHLCVAMKVAFKLKLADNETFAKLLLSMYQCQNTFEGLYMGIFFRDTAPFFWHTDWDSQFENYQALMYFSLRANKCGLKFGSDPHQRNFMDVPLKCFSCSPLKLAAQLNQPHQLLIILRYGGTVYNGYDKEDAAERIVRKLIIQQSRGGNYLLRTLRCLRYLLRAVVSLKMENIYKIDENAKESCLKLMERGILPANRIGINPPQLKHLARCAVRKSMIEHGMVPHGIAKLEIPEMLKQYVDLIRD